jgi:ATP-binding cassette subfamily B protein
VLAATRSGDYYPEADVQTQFGMNSYAAVRAFSRGVDARLAASPPPVGAPAASVGPPSADALPAAPREVIRFEAVTFRYPGQDRPVLDGLDLTIPIGRCTAIVGLNGAGKTTLVKLLARLYEPDSGRITVDGVDLRGMEAPAWRRRLGVIFQDFVRYETSLADNIGFGALARIDDRAGILRAARAAGLGDVIDGLPAGLDTPATREIDGGVELSGGQWQRLAIARALFAADHGASVLVVDEPTASLDVRAEAHFIDEMIGLTRRLTTVVISHRFSTVRHADAVAVLAQGRVVEHGTHDELVARDGRYARLFRLQAARFADEETMR